MHIGMPAFYSVTLNPLLPLPCVFHSQDIQSLLRQDPVVCDILDTKTEEIGPSIFRFKAEVAWDGEELAARYLSRVGRERLIERLQKALRDPDPMAIDEVLKVGKRGALLGRHASVHPCHQLCRLV
jgi:zinc transporter 9